MTTSWIQPYLKSFKSKTSHYASTFKQYPLWKQSLISTAAITCSSIACMFGSYYFYKLRCPSVPIVHYTTTGDINNNKGILVFIHGYPDHEYLWDDQVKFFTEKNYCCITLEIPNFHPDRMQNPWGYELPIVVKAIANTLKQILNNHAFILVAHDWGAFLAELLYLDYKTDINVSKLILLDVADGRDPDPKQDHKYNYQGTFAFLFLMPTFIGTYMLRNMFNAWRRNAQVAVPIFDKEKKDNRSYVFSGALYLYYYAIKSRLTGHGNTISVTSRLNECDGLPILFIDGNKGEDPTRFYTPKFREFVEKREYCKFEQFDDSGHFIMAEQSTKLNNSIYQFIQ